MTREPWKQIESTTALDRHFAELIGELSTNHRFSAALAAMLASMAVGEGAACLRLDAWAGRALGEAGGDEVPDLVTWRHRLLESGVVGKPGERLPLVLDEENRLYLYRYWYYEDQIARQLQARAQWTDPWDPGDLTEAVSRVFPGNGGETGIDWQKIAALVALRKRLCVISGGPGTGKTTTAVRLIALLQRMSPTPLRVVMAAPTGKAAGRLMEALAAMPRDDSDVAAGAAAMPDEAFTLHRLLGMRPNDARPRYREDNPLPADLVVIDEASMVDMSLMHAVLMALPDTCRLVLIGDRHQLASVEAGSVFGDICHADAGTRFSSRMRSWLGPWLGENGPADPTDTMHPLVDCMVYLERRYRFDAAPGIGDIADAVQSGDAEVAARMLEDGIGGGEWILPDTNDAIRKCVAPYVRSRQQAVLACNSPHDALRAMKQVQVLCAVNYGPRGVDTLNGMVETLLAADPGSADDAAGEWYPGRPVLINQNDYELGLFNGDLGITLDTRDSPGGRQICFGRNSETLICVHPRQLPAHEAAHAMTIHKSQGSEFEHVVLILPDRDMALLSRELIYTGITRARRRITLIGEPDIWAQAVERHRVRPSGLRDALWSGRLLNA